jgi:hypothetical protein
MKNLFHKVQFCNNKVIIVMELFHIKRKSIALSICVFIVSIFLALPVSGANLTSTNLLLAKNKFKIVFSDKEPAPLKIALKALQKDFKSVMDFNPAVAGKLDKDNSLTTIVIVNRASGAVKAPVDKGNELKGFESHRVYADAKTNRIYLEGYDLRGTIYAIYTFSEKILGIPPLHYWASWIPTKLDSINVPSTTDFFFKSPQVRYRAFLTNDEDYFTPWRKAADGNENIWLETVLRLKLNTIETANTVKPGYKMSADAYRINDYGLVLTSHHTNGLNTSFGSWDTYWKEVRKMDPPKLLLSNEKAICEFFKYNAETVQKSGIENLWTLAFRGKGDQPFWSVFEDAPAGEKERADVINKMLQIQLDDIKEVTGNPNPYVRLTFYDELATLMSKGYLKPTVSQNIIWTYCSGRRDHYPYDDIVNFDTSKPVKLGFYMNFQFTSTGAHVAPAEGPWKMEFNYRYVNSKSPLYFSVINAGNIREFVLEISANAKMLWDYNSYNSDQFVLDYSKQYYGDKYAKDIAQLYKDYFYSFWTQKKPLLPGLDRQFIFQDLRYARVFDQIIEKFYTDSVVNLNPLTEIGYEHVQGRSFRIDLKDNNSDNQIDAILKGLKLTIPKFESVAARSTDIMLKLDQSKQTFFDDNLRIYSYYMTHLNKSLYYFLTAYKNQKDKEILIRNLKHADAEIAHAQQYLLEGEHGMCSEWYTKSFPLSKIKTSLEKLRTEALIRN